MRGDHLQDGIGGGYSCEPLPKCNACMGLEITLGPHKLPSYFMAVCGYEIFEGSLLESPGILVHFMSGRVTARANLRQSIFSVSNTVERG